MIVRKMKNADYHCAESYHEKCRSLHLQGICSAVATISACAACCGLVVAAASRISAAVMFGCWMLAEILFMVWFQRHARRLSQQPYVHAPSSDEPLEKFHHFVADAPVISKYTSLERCISRWFGEAPFHEIKRDNIAELFTYGFWYQTREEMARNGNGQVVHDIPALLEQSWGLKFEPGYNPSLTFNAHLWQPLRFWYRPLFVYIVMEFLALIRHVSMLATGFKCNTMQGMVYYTYGLQPSSTTAQSSATAASRMMGSKEPILFLHGVGAGLLPYVGFVHRLVATGHPVVAIECRHLSMRLCKEVPECDMVAAICESILDHLAIPRCHIASHSFGTFIASRLLQRIPKRIDGLCLIDPVCFLLFTGQLVNNFVYRPELLNITRRVVTCWQSRKGQWLSTGRELLSCMVAMLAAIPSCFISREIHCSAAVARRFYWSTLNLAAHQLPKTTLVVLSGHDKVTPTPEIKCMLEASGAPVRILHHPTHSHAQFLLHGDWQDRIVREMLEVAGDPLPEDRQLSTVSPYPIRVHAYSDSASSLTYKGL